MCSKRLKEEVVRFYACEVLLALQYLHVQGYVYRCAERGMALVVGQG